ncbi:MAG: hypothetical protein QM564_13310 [Bergeyella sp.]
MQSIDNSQKEMKLNLFEKYLMEFTLLGQRIINTPINYFLLRRKKEYSNINFIFKKYRLWGNPQLVNIIKVDHLLKAEAISPELAENYY